jgi:hypothetical protein
MRAFELTQILGQPCEFQVTAAGAEAAPKVCGKSFARHSKTESWGGVTCNENLRLVNTDVKGIGRDFFWPPNVEDTPRCFRPCTLVQGLLELISNCSHNLYDAARERDRVCAAPAGRQGLELCADGREGWPSRLQVGPTAGV